jgi:DnaK suppressor protein
MSTPISDSFELQLRAHQRELQTRLLAQRGGTRGRADVAADKRERADEDGIGRDEAFDLGAVLGEREAAELLAIDRALQRIADGSYGLCRQCGARIPAARLHAQPTAERCVDCQARAE